MLVVPTQALAFDIDDLRALITAEQLATVEQVIGRLPMEYRQSYTLAYDSQSLQGSSQRHPRAILFGRTAQLVLTFNGEPSQRHYHAIEAMQFRAERNVFELYSIDFSGDRPRFSDPNPEVCAGCHGTPARPIWSSYEYGERETSHWPGFYGSTHDAPPMDDAEKAAFLSFKEQAADHPRYRHLVLDKAGAPWFPYGSGPGKHSLRPNNRLGNLLARWHARQIAALIDQGDFIERYPNVAQAWLLQCPDIEGKAYRRRVHNLFEARFPTDSHGHAHALLDNLSPPRRTAFMMEKLLTGSDSFGWDMSIESPEASGRFYTGIATIDRLVGARWLSTLDTGHWLKRYFRPWGSRELYNTFQEGYYESNVQPGGVGRAYDSVATYFDEALAQTACPNIMSAALPPVDTVSR